MKILTKLLPFARQRKASPMQKINGRKVVFIHINKTGGTSVLDALNLNKSHLSAKEIIDIIGESKFKSSYKFAAVRNPWDKAFSHYKYRIKTNQTNLGTNRIPFPEWVKKTYGQDKDLLYYDKPKMFQPQVEWLKDYQGNIDIDQIMKFEDLNREFEKVAGSLGLNVSLPHLNKTKHADYKEFYDADSKSIIAEWFAEDIATFEYTY